MIEVLSVASEAYPLIKTGGLADVVGALPAALAPHGVSMRVLLPGYPRVTSGLTGGHEIYWFEDLFGGEARLIAGRANGLDAIAIDAPHLYDRPGNPYVGPDGSDWPDNWRRFAALSWVAGELGLGLVEGYSPQVIHAHDWQAGLVPAYVKFGPSDRIKTVMTVHNMAFQGQFGAEIFGQLRLPPHAFSVEGVEYYGQIGFLKAGLVLADHITTVSPTYAIEIQGSEMGMGLDGLLRHRAGALTGILNGIDTTVWDPAADPHLPARYSPRKLEVRKANAAAIRERFGLAPSDGMLMILVGRLTWQKGIDLVLRVIPRLVAEGNGPIPLVLSPAPDVYRKRALSALDAAGRDWRIVYTSPSLAGLQAAVQAGLGVTVLPTRSVSVRS